MPTRKFIGSRPPVVIHAGSADIHELTAERGADGVYEPVPPVPGALAIPGAPLPLAKPRQLAVAHLEAALATGVRGELRDAIQRAIRVASADRQRDRTDLEYAELKPGEELVDAKRPGFLARANRRGTRFIYRYRDPETNRQGEHSIGYLGDISLTDARAEWDRLRARRMARKPLALEAPEQPAENQLPTIKKLVELYLKDYAEKVKRPRSAAEDGRQLYKHVLPTYGNFLADQFTHTCVAELLAGLQDKPVEARKLRATISTMFNVGAGRTKKLVLAKTWLPRGFPNPVTDVTLPEHSARVPAPSEAAIKRYAAGLYTLETMRQDFRDALLFQLLCASRIREVVEMSWDELDLEASVWTLPAARSKNKREHVVFLSAPALTILQRRHEWKAPKDTYVFPAPGDRKQALRVDLTQKALAENRKALGVGADFTSHRVRHAFTTWAAENGYPLDTVNRCTAHVTAVGINAHYNMAKLNTPARDLWKAWAEFLGQANG